MRLSTLSFFARLPGQFPSIRYAIFLGTTIGVVTKLIRKCRWAGTVLYLQIWKPRSLRPLGQKWGGDRP
ncbi:hypothetical protein CO674_34260 [Rhizobium hidalgonense]|uniref:Uncharacterized protein n=1 Tax=Rhizobium hidalgonense TaxID=1538159 RepID=A0ABX4JH07_9HYPH|nr:hypothetical protein CO659_28895 [Rhizobium sp. S9]PDT07462.1 hypothetical protein CO655_27105 [Rhizobium sp. M1]PDT19209.1 hypothetical protein CO674_34260 [Rhizobium hidalgonense]